MLDPRHLLRWVYLGRLSVASAIFIAGVVNWAKQETDASKLTVVTVAFALVTVLTVVSFAYSEIYRKPLGKTFLYLQSILDLLLVTVVVHVTPGSPDSGSVSQFSALYILVIATATLMLPVGGGLLVAALGIVLFFADTVFGLNAQMHNSIVWAQLGVFAAVSLGCAILASQLQKAGEGKEVLVAALEHARVQADDILRNIQSGVVTIDSGGNLRYANPKAQTLLGVDLESAMGVPVVDQIQAVAPELAQALEQSVTNRIRTLRGEGTVTAGGRRFPIGVTTTYTEGDGQRTERTATAIFQDISDQKRIDTLRLRAQRLEGVAELSASLAHEIKNPLASIRSAVEQLAKMRQESADQQTLSGLVLRESDRLSRLLTEFLDFARVRVSRTGSVNVADLVRGAARLVEAHPDRRDVCVVCTAPDDESLVVQGDEDLLHRAVFNLVLNAAQASPDGGTVRVDAIGHDAGPASPRCALRPGERLGAGERRRVGHCRSRSATGCSIRSSPPRQAAAGSGSPWCTGPSRRIAAWYFSTAAPRGTTFTVILPQAQTPTGDTA